MKRARDIRRKNSMRGSAENRRALLVKRKWNEMKWNEAEAEAEDEGGESGMVEN